MAKKPVGYKIDEEVLKEFNRIADERAINKSKWIENQMKEFLRMHKIELLTPEEYWGEDE